jgi:DNA ligase-1
LNLPTLYKQTSTGKIQEWTIGIQNLSQVPAAALIVTEYGLKDGKKQKAIEKITQGKNLGKANETTPFEQADLEAKSQWEQKLKKGYVQTLEDAQAGKKDAIIQGGIAPMLAHSYDKQGHKIKYPAFVQPKLDGHRCIAVIQDGKCELWSRTQKKITGVPHIARQLEQMFPNETIILDGELYNHDYREKFEELTSFIRSATPKPGHEVVQYWIYDVATDGTFADRTKRLRDEFNYMAAEAKANQIIIIQTDEVANEEEMIEIFGVYMSYGFEGLMTRNKAGRYKNGRSYDLQKVKTFQDAEYPVVAVEEGKGKMAGKAMFVCDAGNGKTFRVKMVGALDDLKTYFDNPEPWIGKQLTVKFQKYSAEGMPIFPVGMRFREDV